MNELPTSDCVLLILLVWASWFMFYQAGKRNLFAGIGDVISGIVKYLSGEDDK